MKKFTLLLATILSVMSVAMCACGCSDTKHRTPSVPSAPSSPSTPDVTDDTGNGNGDSGDDDGDTNPDEGTDPNGNDGGSETETPKNTNTTVYYTNSLRWNSVYAFQWNYSTGAAKSAWPGTRLSATGTSGYGEQQFSVAVDYSVYDRIIFNNGSGAQTKDLVVGAATSGYYGEDGTFTMNNANGFGNVRYVTLIDTQNLGYIPGARKKVSIYTPPGYSSAKKYGVLYMFDSQNLYKEAAGAAPSDDSFGSWAVDVAVANLVKNGNDGVIIVAIDTTDGHRDSELTMSTDFGALTSLTDGIGDFYNGKLDELGNFMKDTLIPYVKANYSVDGSREKTGIAGSSSGGLAAYYLGLRDNDIYGYIGALSPANGLFGQNDWTRFYSSKNFDAGRPKIYAYCGNKNDGYENRLLPATRQIKSSLTSYGFAAEDIFEYYLDGGAHNESYWRIAFQEFLGKMV